MQHATITNKAIRAFYNVYNKLGHGFLEKVYHKAMIIELQKQGLKIQTECAIDVYYDGIKIGRYYADLILEGKVILELKAISTLKDTDKAQLINYLKATTIEVGLLLNFGAKPEFSRLIFNNNFTK